MGGNEKEVSGVLGGHCFVDQWLNIVEADHVRREIIRESMKHSHAIADQMYKNKRASEESKYPLGQQLYTIARHLANMQKQAA